MNRRYRGQKKVFTIKTVLIQLIHYLLNKPITSIEVCALVETITIMQHKIHFKNEAIIDFFLKKNLIFFFCTTKKKKKKKNTVAYGCIMASIGLSYSFPRFQFWVLVWFPGKSLQGYILGAFGKKTKYIALSQVTKDTLYRRKNINGVTMAFKRPLIPELNFSTSLH